MNNIKIKRSERIFSFKIYGILLIVLMITAACVPPDNSANNANNANTQNTNSVSESNSNAADSSNDISTTGDEGEEKVSNEELERGRMEGDWKNFVEIDSSDQPQPANNPEKLEDITPERVNTGKTFLPLAGDVSGPSVLRVQLLLDRSPFSPGIIDGRWGKNTEKAVYWMQKREGLKANGTVDEKTFQRLSELAGKPDKLIVEHKLTAEDVKGPFVEIPEDVYEKAKLDCMCYESLEEKLSEMFHVGPELLKRLNPNVNLNEVKAGDTLMVPNLQGENQNSPAQVARLIISDGGRYIHAVDEGGKILYHFPSTLGSTYAPSPGGEYKITAIAEDPTWHYQPKLLTGVDDSLKDAIIPAGPNNPVGKVWMSLSKPHYGIHGTKAPETIGYATSHGCVRLTNWDVVFLKERIKSGAMVEFRDTKSNSDAQKSNTNS